MVSGWRKYDLRYEHSSARHVPRRYVEEIYSGDSRGQILKQTLDLEDACKALLRDTLRLEKAVDSPTGSLFSFFISAVEQLLGAEAFVPLIDRIRNGVRYVFSAIHIVKQITEAFEEGFHQPFLYTTIGIDLRYPTNILTGQLMSSDWMRNRTPNNRDTILHSFSQSLRQFAKKAVPRNNLAESLCHQHAIHLLGRFGDDNDRDLIRSTRDDDHRASDL